MPKLKTLTCNMRKGLEMESDLRSHKWMTAPALLTFPAFIFIIHYYKLNLMSLPFWKQSQLSILIIASFEGNLPFLSLAILKIFSLTLVVNGFTKIGLGIVLYEVIPFLTQRSSELQLDIFCEWYILSHCLFKHCWSPFSLLLLKLQLHLS